MTDLVVTAAEVRPLKEQGAETMKMLAGGTMAVGDAVYLSAAGTVSAADASGFAGSCAIGVLVAVQPGAASAVAAAAGDYVDVCWTGPVSGYTATYGTLYYVDDDAGVLSDTAGTKDCIVGIGIDTNTLMVRPRQIDLS